MQSNKYIVVKYSELHLKGGNKKEFIRVLMNNIKFRLEKASIEAKVINGRDRIIIKSDNQLNDVVEQLRYIVGISSYGYFYDVEPTRENIEKLLIAELPFNENKKFRLSIKIVGETSVGDKKEVTDWLAWFAMNKLGYKIDLSNHDVDISLRIENGIATLNFEVEKGIIGLPAGANGKALTLLSGGIDSPVAAFKTITRGINTSFITFLTPRTSEANTLNKIRELANQVDKYNGTPQKLFLVNFEKVQEEIMKLEDTSYRITLLRRYFMRFAQMVSWKYKYKFLITGDSLGQVASQTPESMTQIDNATDQLIVRPLVSMAKNEIIKIAEEIGTYEISIKEGDDMCSLFTPKNPIIFPKKEKVKELESLLVNIDEVLKKVLDEDVRVIDL